MAAVIIANNLGLIENSSETNAETIVKF